MASREKRRLKLIRSAAELFLAKGSAGVSMQDVAEAANVSRATLYTYFRSKDEIFDKFLAVKALDRAGNETVPTAIPAIAKLI